MPLGRFLTAERRDRSLKGPYKFTISKLNKNINKNQINVNNKKGKKRSVRWGKTPTKTKREKMDLIKYETKNEKMGKFELKLFFCLTRIFIYKSCYNIFKIRVWLRI